VNASAGESAVVSFTGCLALTPIVRALCTRHRILDSPGPLKIHTRPVPRLGGVAVALSIAAGILVSARHDLRANGFVLGALGVVWIASVVDDLRSISPYTRLVAQIASGVLLWLAGWRFLLGDLLPQTGPMSLSLVCGTVVLFTNALNFLDGSDGLASGVAAIIGAAWLAISRGAAHDSLTSIVAACLTASCCAFLFYNSAPATIHLGDSGSNALGFCVAFLALSRPQGANAASSLAAATLLISALPIMDLALAVFRRLRSRASLLQGDRLHLYDRMLSRRYSPRAVALFFYAMTIVLAVAAWLGMQLGVFGRLVLWMLSLAGVLISATWLGMSASEDRKMQPGRPAKFGRKETEMS
jgi:UDP-GlcNAc:undecaprenyl-phosphate/decaprenyl-phosphate GlcNAc-1-phosphate transferase